MTCSTNRGNVTPQLDGSSKSKPSKVGLKTGLNQEVNDTLTLPSFALSVAKHLWEGFNTPTSLGLYLCATYNDIASIITHDINPSWYLDAASYRIDIQACKLLSKMESGIEIPGVDPVKAAEELFLECELACERQNAFWRDIDCGRATLPIERENLVHKVRTLVSEILGDLCVEEWVESCRLGPGLTAFGPESSQDYVKLSTTPQSTSRFVELATGLIGLSPSWFLASTTYHAGVKAPVVEEVKGGKFATVPKKVLTDRCIETQPMLNGYGQLGLGQVIRRRLAAVSIDLHDQTLNQRLAHKGSIDGSLATIDLSNASDMISSGVVCSLIPSRWLTLMKYLRTSEILFRGEWRPIARFSSMGNGFTFELETLLFYAITRAICGPKATVSVYGDDIICPSQNYAKVVDALEFFGFTVNLKKSYASGPFRESCGKDYFQGVNVRPFYLKGVPLNVSEIVRVVNGLCRAAGGWDCNFGLDRRYFGSISYTLRRIPVRVRARLAIGWPSDDSYLCGVRHRKGAQLVYRSNNKRPENWNAAVVTLLYRLDKRYQNYADTTGRRLTKLVDRTRHVCNDILEGRSHYSRQLNAVSKHLSFLEGAAVKDETSRSIGRNLPLTLPTKEAIRKDAQMNGSGRYLLQSADPRLRVDKAWNKSHELLTTLRWV